MTSTVPTLPLNDKRAIPAIAFGTGTALFGRNVKAYIAQALDGGFNHIDTAQAYGNEESVGDALREALGYKIDSGDEKVDIQRQVMGRLGREDIWVTTKYRGVGDAQTALDASLKKLGLSYVDLYLIHAPSIVPDILATWSEFEQAQANGKVKSIGVSNFNIEQLQLILEHGKVVPAVNQVLFHPYNYHEQAELLEFSKAHGIRIESYGGLRPINKLPGGKLDGVLDGIAKRLGPKVTEWCLEVRPRTKSVYENTWMCLPRTFTQPGLPRMTLRQLTKRENTLFPCCTGNAIWFRNNQLLG